MNENADETYRVLAGAATTAALMYAAASPNATADTKSLRIAMAARKITNGYRPRHRRRPKRVIEAAGGP